MPKETLKKMLLFSSVENKIIVEKIVADVVLTLVSTNLSVSPKRMMIK